LYTHSHVVQPRAALPPALSTWPGPRRVRTAQLHKGRRHGRGARRLRRDDLGRRPGRVHLWELRRRDVGVGRHGRDLRHRRRRHRGARQLRPGHWPPRHRHVHARRRVELWRGVNVRQLVRRAVRPWHLGRRAVRARHLGRRRPARYLRRRRSRGVATHADEPGGGRRRPARERTHGARRRRGGAARREERRRHEADRHRCALLFLSLAYTRTIGYRKQKRQGKGRSAGTLARSVKSLYGWRLDTFGDELEYVSCLPKEVASCDTCVRVCRLGVYCFPVRLVLHRLLPCCVFSVTGHEVLFLSSATTGRLY